jgi:hypothetical protein
VDYGIEGTELIGLVGNNFRSGDSRKVSGDDPLGPTRSQDGVTAPTGVSAMSLLDQQLGGE